MNRLGSLYINEKDIQTNKFPPCKNLDFPSDKSLIFLTDDKKNSLTNVSPMQFPLIIKLVLYIFSINFINKLNYRKKFHNFHKKRKLYIYMGNLFKHPLKNIQFKFSDKNMK